MSLTLGYIRISTKGQRPDRQIRGLSGLCDKLYIETFSAATVKSRPVFDKVMKKLERGYTFYVWDLDRAFRNTADAIYHAQLLRERGIIFKAANFVIDTITADGHHAYVANASAAQRERMKISERTIEGLQAAKARGVKLGRPAKMSENDVRAAISALGAKEANLQELGARFGVNPWTVTRSIRRYKKV